MRVFLVLLVLLSLPVRAGGADPILDGFGIHNAGSVAISGSVHAVAVQRKDGMIVIGGDFTLTDVASLATRKNLARIRPDGTLDASFIPPLLNGAVHAIALQPDLVAPANPDLIIIGGSFTSAGGSSRKGLARLTGGTGSLDAFDPVTTTAAAPVINAITLRPGGAGILVGGSFSEIKEGAPSRNLAGISVADTGSINWSYTGGLNDDAGNLAIHAILLQEGVIVVGGKFTTSWSENIARFLQPGGDYDASFRPASPGGTVLSLALQSDGKILLGGDFTGGALARSYLARLNGDGTPDPFDAGFDANPGSHVASMVVQPDGRILVAGRFTIGPALAQRKNLARLNIDGTLNGAYFPHPNDVVKVIALQADAKILAGGDFTAIDAAPAVPAEPAVPRTSLARFYPQGALDDDIPAVVSDAGMVLRTSLHPDGSTTIAGLFEQVGTAPRFHIARLKEDWSLDPGFDAALRIEQRVFSMASLPDRSLLIGGNFLKVNGILQDSAVGVDPAGVPAPATFNTFLHDQLESGGDVMATALPPDGTLAEDGMVYLGGNLGSTAPYQYLARFKSSGERDAGFEPDPAVDGQVLAIAIEPLTNMVIVGTETGRILRLDSQGNPDPGWRGGAFLQLSGGVNAITMLPDGGIIAAGAFQYPGGFTDPDTGLQVPLKRNLLRINSGGWVDESFVVEALYTYDENFSTEINGVSLRADGSMVIYGVFDQVRDGRGALLQADYLARIRPGGEIDLDFDLGYFDFASETPIEQVNSVSLQPDGKLLVAGAFINLFGKQKLARFSSGWTAQELSVSVSSLSSDRSKITWLRSGSAPELWRVSFQCWDNLEAADKEWSPLRDAVWTAQGWVLDDVNLAAEKCGVNANRYVRARGYVAGDRGSAGSLLESVRLYYLKAEPVITLLPQSIDFNPPPARTFGDGDLDPGATASSGLPVAYTSSNPEVAIVVNGKIRITGAGSTVITASQGGDGTYSPAPDVPHDFAVAKAPLLVIAQDKARAYLTQNPALTVAYQWFVNGDQSSALSGAPALTTTAVPSSPAGSYPIVVGLDTLSARNYRLVPVNGTLSVFKSCQEITFPAIPERTFGDPPFEIVAVACSGLGLSFTSSNPSVAQVNGNVITITGAGSAVITASQQGSGGLESAPDRSRTFIVHKSGQGVSFSSLAQHVLGDPPFILDASATSGLPVSYLSSDPGVAAVSGNTVTLVGAGTTVISALQPGNGNYHAALPAAQPLTVASEGVPPQLALSTLPSGAVTSNPVLNIMGGASDASGIASLTVNGADLTGEATLFSSAVGLAAGVNSIIVAARDGAGNRAAQTLSVILDALAPAVTLDAPADNSVTDIPSCTVSGSVTPGTAVTLGVNGESLQLLQVTDGRFSGTGYLAEGVNTVELSAELSGRTSRVKRSVTLAPGRPALAITEPAQDLRTEQQSLTIRGRTGAQLPGSVVLEVDGTVFTPELLEGVFQQQVALPRAGEIRITARATDGGGQTSLARRNIIRIDRIAGDLDGNGSIDLEDAWALLRISLGLEPVTAPALAHGDLAPLVNGVPQPDGIIDVGDLLVLLRRMVGLVQF